MTNDVAKQLLQEVRAMRLELKEVHAILFDDSEEDTLENYEHPDRILQALESAKAEFGEPRL